MLIFTITTALALACCSENEGTAENPGIQGIELLNKRNSCRAI